MLGAGHTKAKMVVRSRQVPESEVMRALVSSALISGIDPRQNFLYVRVAPPAIGWRSQECLLL